MPGQYYLFVPFTPQELLQVLPQEPTVKSIAMTWRRDATDMMIEARKRPVIVYHGVTAPGIGWQLEPFNAAQDTLYVIGHCHKGGSHLGSSRGGFRFARAELDAQTIVNRMLPYFPVDMVHFKLFACFGGAFHATENVRTGLMEYDQSFAQKFYSRLKRHYRSAILTAYCLPVMGGLDAGGHKRLSMEDGRGHWGRASGNSITYGA